MTIARSLGRSAIEATSSLRIAPLVGLGPLVAAMGLLAGCQALAPADAVVTLQPETVHLVLEHAALQEAAAIDEAQMVATVSAAGTQVLEHSLLNAALGATLRANYTATPAVRAVVVSAADMGSSLDMMDDMSYEDAVGSVIEVSGLDTALGVNANSGCSTGSVKQFGTDVERIYATARMTNLLEGTYFEIDWLRQNRVVNRLSWLADYDAPSECIWFYVTQEDFAFLPGSYTATLFVNGISQASTDFTVSSS